MAGGSYDVIVVGAGPAGSTAAEITAKAGFRTLLIERYAKPGAYNSCGGGLGYFLKDLFELPDELVLQTISKVKLQLGDRVKEYDSGSRPIYMSVIREDFDSFLAYRARDCSAELMLSTRAMDYDPYHRKLTCLNRETREKFEVTGKIVIFADGCQTLAWKTCRIGLPGDEPLLLGIAREMEMPPEMHLDSYEFFFDEINLPYGYFWVFPKGNIVNVGLGGPIPMVKGKIDKMLDAFLETRPELKDLKVVRSNAGLIPGTIANKFHGAGVMVVGDAAGFLNPLTGGGIFLGMKSAQYAAKTAIEALQNGRYDSHFLARYTHRIKFSAIYPSVRFFEYLVKWSQNYRRKTGKPMLGHVFRVYSDLMAVLLKFIKDV